MNSFLHGIRIQVWKEATRHWVRRTLSIDRTLQLKNINKTKT